jgi:YidC/Oxa1 family membrane protein insertase
MRKLQQEHRGDRQKLNEEMMKLYQQHKVNPLASCFPLLLQFPVFIIMYQVLSGLTRGPEVNGKTVFEPEYVSESSKLYQSLKGDTEMKAWGLDLAQRPMDVITDSFSRGLIYALLVVVLGVLYFVQQKMVAARASVSPTMSPMQQKLMQYLPVVFAVFLVFYLTGLVIYYMAQAIFRIGLQYYTTHKFYKGEQSLGRQAQAAGERAREIAKKDGGGRRDVRAGAPRPRHCQGVEARHRAGRPAPPRVSKRVTPAEEQADASGPAEPPSASSGRNGRPTPPAPRPKKKS